MRQRPHSARPATPASSDQQWMRRFLHSALALTIDPHTISFGAFALLRILKRPMPVTPASTTATAALRSTSPTKPMEGFRSPRCYQPTASWVSVPSGTPWQEPPPLNLSFVMPTCHRKIYVIDVRCTSMHRWIQSCWIFVTLMICLCIYI